MRLRTLIPLSLLLAAALAAGCTLLAPPAEEPPPGAPEVGEYAEPFGEEAAAYTAGAIPVGTTVWLETDAELRDRHGRLLAYVWLERPITGDEAEVRSAGRGFWAE